MEELAFHTRVFNRFHSATGTCPLLFGRAVQSVFTSGRLALKRCLLNRASGEAVLGEVLGGLLNCIDSQQANFLE